MGRPHTNVNYPYTPLQIRETTAITNDYKAGFFSSNYNVSQTTTPHLKLWQLGARKAKLGRDRLKTGHSVLETHHDAICNVSKTTL